MRNPVSARWALCFIEELTKCAQQTDAAQALKAVASIILNTSHAEVAEIVAAHDARWVFHGNTRVGVVWTGKHILLREPPLPGDMVFDVPDTWPRVVIVADPNRPRKKALQFKKRRAPAWTRATFLPRLLTTLAGAEYRLDDAREILGTLQYAFEAGKTVTGVVKGLLPKGYRVDIGVDAFLPEEQLLLGGHNTDDLIGSNVEVRITSFFQKTQTINVALATQSPPTPPPVEVWQEIQKCFDANETVTGRVTASGHSGFAVNVYGMTTFVPFDELQASEKQKTQDLTGKTLDFCIFAIDTANHDLTLSRRFEEFDSWKSLRDAMKAKKPIPGKVEKAVKGGYRVDIGMKQAFVPLSLIKGPGSHDRQSWVGNTYDFHIVKLDWKRQGIVLSRRELLKPDPDRAKRLDEITSGDTLKGTVSHITDYGAFMDLNGVDGLLLLKDMSWHRTKHPSELLRIGQSLDVLVLHVNKEKERVSLGLKQLTSSPWDNIGTKYSVGTRLKRKIANIADYGAFVDMEAGIEGLVHVSEISWAKPPIKASDVLEIGDEVEVVVLSVDCDRKRIALSIKQLITNPWDNIETKYPVGTRLKRKIVTVADFGAFVELEPGIKGLVHVGDISWTNPPVKASDVLEVGDEVEIVVLSVDGDRKRIALGIR